MALDDYQNIRVDDETVPFIKYSAHREQMMGAQTEIVRLKNKLDRTARKSNRRKSAIKGLQKANMALQGMLSCVQANFKIKVAKADPSVRTELAIERNKTYALRRELDSTRQAAERLREEKAELADVIANQRETIYNLEDALHADDEAYALEA